MNDNLDLYGCSEDDALEFSNGIYRIKKIINSISSVFLNYLGEKLSELLSKNSQIRIYPNTASDWFNKGIDCEILRVGGKSWEKGKLKINVSVEFIHDEVEETESPLDNVRQEINQS